MNRPSKCLTVEEAQNLQENWVTTREVYIEDAMQQPDNRVVFYTLAELEEYIAYVKTLSEEQQIENPGIRIYFGAYDNEESDKATVFLAPALGNLDTSENNYDIDPFNSGAIGWPPKPY